MKLENKFITLLFLLLFIVCCALFSGCSREITYPMTVSKVVTIKQYEGNLFNQHLVSTKYEIYVTGAQDIYFVSDTVIQVGAVIK